jgi:methyl-accepting chemotaxis protein
MVFIGEVEQVMNNVQNGILTQKITLETENEVLQKLKQTINDGLQILEDNFTKINIILKEYAQYKYTNKISLDNYAKNGIFDLLLVNINAIHGAINEMLVEASKNGIVLDASAKKLLENVDVLNNSSTKAENSLIETLSEVEKMTYNVEKNTENTMQMIEYTKSLANSSKEGKELAVKTTEAMNQINEEVTAINSAISIIDKIAFQTNILSLNAAVEASTAGEAGKGFAVVAHEVRNLAAKSTEASNEIKALVSGAIDKADRGKDISDKMIKGYDRLNQDISDTIELIQDLESSSKDQDGAIVKINHAMSQLDSQVQQNTDAINKTKDIAMQTYDIASDIVNSSDEKEFLGKVKVS